MRNHFTPRRKKLTGPSVVGKMKSVRIDANTLIYVSASISDEEARNRYIKRYKSGNRPPEFYMPPKIKNEISKDIDPDSLEELRTPVEDTIAEIE